MYQRFLIFLGALYGGLPKARPYPRQQTPNDSALTVSQIPKKRSAETGPESVSAKKTTRLTIFWHLPQLLTISP